MESRIHLARVSGLVCLWPLCRINEDEYQRPKLYVVANGAN
jgi:hypothetical protein